MRWKETQGKDNDRKVKKRQRNGKIMEGKGMDQNGII